MLIDPRPTDKREALQRKADAPLRPRAAQAACDHGLFGDEPAQADLCELARRLTPRE